MREHWCFVDSKPSDQLLFQNMSFVCWFIECWDTEMCFGYFPWNFFPFSFPEWLVLLLQSTALSLSQIPNSASYCVFLGFPGGTSGKEPTCQCRDIRDLGSVPGSGRSPEEGLATRSSILSWRIPWTEEPGGLQSMGSQRVRHNWSTLPLTYFSLLYFSFRWNLKLVLN